MRHKSIPPIKNPETEAYCREMSKEYKKILKKHPEGSTEFIRERMKLSERMIGWMNERKLARWEQLAIADRVIFLAKQAA